MSSSKGAPQATGAAPQRSIYQTLRRDIVTLRLRPGERLSENEMALRFGTSRAPVREALIRLTEDGLIHVLPQRGSYVTRISLRGMERGRFVREALEVAIVRRAAEGGLMPAQRQACERILKRQAEARNDPERFTELDDAFHRSFAEAVDLDAVWGIVEREKVHFDRVRFLSLPMVTPVKTLIRQHEAILAAVADKDPDAAETAIRVHMSEVLQITQGLMARHPDLIDTE